ncbi:hypothetical protein EVAR_30487_1 [Eumeta japonica]|uniref:Uncharacterized protein n=1 Tax=Eumeta variegata TaxID=151549 RepID=A0A4C1VY40_EUMVA|nr:hypothetical protein EVAR_30487_1 [Eumeta japonica]
MKSSKGSTLATLTTLARRTFNRADAGPHASLHNLALQCERPSGGHQLLRDLLPVLPNENKVASALKRRCPGPSPRFMPAPASLTGCRRPRDKTDASI